jgi:hypothetical protein
MPIWTFVAANKDKLMEMITAGMEKIIHTTKSAYKYSCEMSPAISDLRYISLMINDDINAII